MQSKQGNLVLSHGPDHLGKFGAPPASNLGRREEDEGKIQGEIRRGVGCVSEMDAPPENDCCSICHGNFHVPCQANCSHWFCGNCILQVWSYGSTFQPCKCPLCRREITLLIPSDASSRQRHDSQVAETLGNIERYNRYFGERSNGLIQRLQDLPFLLKRLLREMMDPQRSLPLFIRARVCLAMLVSAIYILSPVDIIPDGIMGIIGFVDDALIALICFLHVAALYRSVLLFRHGGA